MELFEEIVTHSRVKKEKWRVDEKHEELLVCCEDN